MSRNQVVSNYIDGNLSDAKAGASRITWRNLYLCLCLQYGMSHDEARTAADYLKGKGTFQAACDAQMKARAL